MNLPRLTCSVKSVSWECDLATMGDFAGLCAIVRLSAARNKDAPNKPVRKEFSVEFRISEYSGRPPAQGGGSISREIEVIKCDASAEVLPGRTVEVKVATKWLVGGVKESSPEGDLPEFRCQACISGAGPHSKLLRVGSVSSICWQRLGALIDPPNGKAAEFWFQDTQKVGLRLEGTGMQGFTADFRIFSDPDDRPAVGNESIRTIAGVPVVAGVAETDWGLTEAEQSTFAFDNFKFDVVLRHSNLSSPIALPRYRFTEHPADNE